MNSRHCPHCHYIKTIKFGKVSGRQRYRCSRCGKTWTHQKESQRLKQNIWDDYVRGGISTKKLAQNYGFSQSKIQRILKEFPMPKSY